MHLQQMLNSTSPPLISIIMPTYNRANYIMQSVQSIQNQTYQNWELVIVDDGSEDATAELLSNLKDGRIKFYEAGRIGLVGKIKNIGIQNSSGEFIAFIDSDDLWAPEKLETQVRVMQEHQAAGFCVCGGYNFKIPGEAVEYFYKRQDGKKYGNLFIDAFQSGMAGFTQALLLKRTCLEKTGYFDESRAFADTEFMLRLSFHFNGVIVYQPLLFRRLHDDNHNSSAWIENYQAGLRNILTYREQLPKKVSDNALFKLYINFGEDHLARRNRMKAVHKFLTSWRYKPFSIVPIKKTGKAILGYLA